ncbi:hypothetical protein JTE90_015651 [Oedothorax gibbosus]|uniref:Uncharacterized protein n=1 Tax=Oedothorax gibbosus TaxID=931172 RepID=A0AAV6USJ1_9ARAC|nr:hypothetical protein JTE90_015651 [Oedothorax gibbosus]
MVSYRLCGPKLSLCCSIISCWAVIMLVIMGFALSLKSPAFLDDFIDPVADESHYDKEKFVKDILERYKEAARNCYICAALYGVTLIFTVWQYHINLRMQENGE